MAINKNHEFEELNGVKCAIVEKNASKERVAFLKELLEYNGFTVIVTPSPPPKPAPVAAAKPVPVEASASVPASAVKSDTISDTEPLATPGSLLQPIQSLTPDPAAPPVPETFTMGVTNVAFNPTNAIFGRLLRTKNGHVVTMVYWEQKGSISHDEIPYFDQTL